LRKADSSGKVNPANKASDGQERSMRGIGNSFCAKCLPDQFLPKSLLGTTAACALIAAAAIAMPNQAQAQFGGIDGLIRGAIGHGYYRGGGGGSSRHHSSSRRSHDDNDDSDGKPSSKSDTKPTDKGGDKTPQSASSDSPPPSKGGASGSSPSGPPPSKGGSSSSAPPKTPEDQPAFTPSR
jgi:hypothetical protein